MPESNTPTQVTPTAETETPTASSTENNQTVTTPTPDGGNINQEEDDKLPFHQHPRWKEREDEWNKKLENLRSEYEEKLKPVKDIAERLTPKEEVQIPSWFGGDEAQWKEYSSWLDSQTDAKAKAAVEAYKSEQQEQTKRVEEATKHFTDSVTSIETDTVLNPSGKKLSESEKNELLKFVYDNELVDSQGRWNYKKGYEFMKATAKESKETPDNLEERKRLAGLSNSDSKPESTPKEYKTSDDFKGGNRPW